MSLPFFRGRRRCRGSRCRRHRPGQPVADDLAAAELDADAAGGEEGQEDALLLRQHDGQSGELVADRLLHLAELDLDRTDRDADLQVVDLEGRALPVPLLLIVDGGVEIPG
jgi:hypothetical protein